jgi:hypothetical protein
MAQKNRPWQDNTIWFFESPRLPRVFTRDQLMKIFDATREELELPKTLSFSRFLRFLVDSEHMRVVKIPPEMTAARNKKIEAAINAGQVQRRVSQAGEEQIVVPGDPVAYRTFTRYIWGPSRPTTPYEVALSLRGGSYLSHASAVFLHALTSEIPRTVYVNKEQSPKPESTGTLTQAGIDRAFRNAPRTSNYQYMFEDTRLVLLSGKHTNNLEVSDIPVPAASVVPVAPGGDPAEQDTPTLLATKLERTLIDIAVRPTYAGGVFQVLEAFRASMGRASVATIIATLRKLKYVYPYHQAIGFYLERGGAAPKQLDRLRAMGVQFDFYLAHKMPEPQYDPTWRIYYPAGLV